MKAEQNPLLKQSPIHESWLTHLADEFDAEYMRLLANFVANEQTSGQEVYPKKDELFAALNSTPLNKVKVVILGQDPYHGENQAHGLSFSVPTGERTPPSLRNIYKEIHSDIGLAIPDHGNLSNWAEQGVLLLNSVLTVRKSEAASHKNQGWEQFTDKLISILDEQCNGIVFLLWGSYAQKKGQVIDQQKHKILTAPHPSPLSAHRGFLGCKHFSLCNTYLESIGKTPINWAN